MKELLEQSGWTMYYECAVCGHKQYFIHPDKKDYEVRTRVKNRTFSILYQGQIICGPLWNYQLEEKLNEYVK